MGWEDKCFRNIDGGEGPGHISMANTLQLYDGNPKSVTTTDRSRRPGVKVTYDGSERFPLIREHTRLMRLLMILDFQGSATGH